MEVTDRIISTLATVVVGKERQLRIALACLLARGHLLIEDLPGVGKTSLAHALAQVLGLSFSRVQFTSDLLPSDILGFSVYERPLGEFVFHPGPVFSQVVLADEINRTTPKTQSALLEAMAEQQVTVDGETRALPQPFFVIATQNPVQQSGTFPLPESQLDRFTMRMSLGYPDAAAERDILAGGDPRSRLAGLQAVTSATSLTALQQRVDTVRASAALIDYVQRLAARSRDDEALLYGLSTRAALALLQSARAWALLDGRDYVIPEDVQAVFVPVVAHRLVGTGEWSGTGAEPLAQRLVDAVDVIG